MAGLAVAEGELAVPLLNEGFELSSEDAVELWADGVQMPPSKSGHGRMDPDRIRRSADGQWVIRRDRIRVLYLRTPTRQSGHRNSSSSCKSWV